MIQTLKKLSILSLLLFSISAVSGQGEIAVRGKIMDQFLNTPIEGVKVSAKTENSAELYTTTSDNSGAFQLMIPSGSTAELTFSKADFLILSKSVDATTSNVDLGVIQLEASLSTKEEDIIPVVTLSESDDSDDDGNISTTLSSSRDPFLNTAAFNFGAARFRIRGYAYAYSTVYFNGVPINDIERGGIYWGTWGGLNDVMRNHTAVLGLAPADFGYGDIGLNTTIDTRAMSQRKQLRASFAVSNRSYRNRAMLTYSTGQLKNGWAVSASASRRWADEGFVEGTFYDAYAYFLSVDKKIGRKHTINATLFGAPNARGKQSAATKELFDLSGSNYYNSYWGYQNGKKRNSRVSHTNLPTAVLRHDWNISDKAILTTAISYQKGENGSTALDWYEAPDPRPDYYRYLPSYANKEQAGAVEEVLRNKFAALQVDWDKMYAANRASFATVEDANGIAGNTVTGKRALYVVEDRRYDPTRINAATTLNAYLGDKLILTTGLSYQNHQTHNYKLLDDLLGAEFYVDIDKFAAFNAAGDKDFIQNDLDTPNKIIKEGDKFGYDYVNHVTRLNGWAQLELRLRKFNLFAAGNAGTVNFWRDGLVRNGKFPDNSFGKSEVQNFKEYGVKAGALFKINGRNYLFANGSINNQAPLMRYAFVSPRTRNQVVDGLKTSLVQSVEGGYEMKAPKAKFRLLGYYTSFFDLVNSNSFYLDNAIRTSAGTSGGFVNYIMTNVDVISTGVEFATEVEVLPSLRLKAVAAIGQTFHTNRPNVTVYLDERAEELRRTTVYIKNFNISSGPKNAYNIGLNYSGKQHWFASLNFNYFDNNWLGFYPERRTLEAVANSSNPEYDVDFIERGSDLWNKIIDQDKAPAGFTLDLFCGKSFQIDWDNYIYVNIGINNILNKTDLITGGYEQSRFDFRNKDVDRYPNRYYYGYGRNYYVSFTYRMR